MVVRDSLAKGQIVPFFILNLDQNNNIFWKCIFEYVKVKEALELREAKIENGSRVPGPDRADRESSDHLKSRALAESRQRAQTHRSSSEQTFPVVT